MLNYLQAWARWLGWNEHRKLSNALIKPMFQLRLPFYMLLMSLVFLGGAMLLGKLYFQQTYLTMLATSTQQDYVQQVVAAQTSEFAMLSVLLLAVYAALTTITITIYTHRLLGPTIPIRRHIRALQEGLYSHRIRLRRHDGLQDLAAELNELAARLEQGKR